MKQVTVNYESDGRTITIVVQAATALLGMRRSRLIGEALRATDDDADVRLWRLAYPDFVAATVQVEGLDWPLPFEQFIALPDNLVGQWERAIYECNPHWRPQPVGEEADGAKKKSPTGSTSG